MQGRLDEGKLEEVRKARDFWELCSLWMSAGAAAASGRAPKSNIRKGANGVHVVKMQHL